LGELHPIIAHEKIPIKMNRKPDHRMAEESMRFPAARKGESRSCLDTGSIPMALNSRLQDQTVSLARDPLSSIGGPRGGKKLAFTESREV
jgi:hypothetical protein